MTTVLTYAGRAWSVIFLLVVLFLIVVFAGGAVYDWRDRRRKRAADVAHVEALVRDMFAADGPDPEFVQRLRREIVPGSADTTDIEASWALPLARGRGQG